MGRLDVGGYARSVAIRSKHVFVAANRTGLVAIQVGRRGRMRIISKLALPGPARDVALALGKYLVVAMGGAGLAVVEAKDPRNMRVISTVKALDYGRGVAA